MVRIFAITPLEIETFVTFAGTHTFFCLKSLTSATLSEFLYSSFRVVLSAYPFRNSLSVCFWPLSLPERCIIYSKSLEQQYSNEKKKCTSVYFPKLLRTESPERCRGALYDLLKASDTTKYPHIFLGTALWVAVRSAK